MNSNVMPLRGEAVPALGEPQQHVIDILRDMLHEAEQGRLQSFVGTGFYSSGERLSFWAESHSDVYPMMGALAWLTIEFAQRHPE